MSRAGPDTQKNCRLLVLMRFMFSRESLITLLVACLWRFLWRALGDPGH